MILSSLSPTLLSVPFALALLSFCSSCSSSVSIPASSASTSDSPSLTKSSGKVSYRSNPTASPTECSANGVFVAVNNYRKKHGAAPVFRHSGLDALAQKHCEYLAKNAKSSSDMQSKINHMGFEGRALVSNHKYKMSTSGKNVAIIGGKSLATGTHMVNSWANSKAHEHTMRQNWTDAGIGYFHAPDGNVYCVQLFGVYSDITGRVGSRF